MNHKPNETMTHTHTHGPWHITDEGSQIVIQTFSDHPTGTLARMYRADELAHSDARLISAAPDMLAALEALLSDKYLSDPINADRMAASRAAIAKATGKGEA